MRIVQAWAADPEVRHEGSIGGVLTALASYLLSSQRVEFILHVKASTQKPTFNERHLSFTHADVIAGAGSRYGPTAPLIDVSELLGRNQALAFIGKPCDVAALRNYAHYDKRVDELVRYWLTPVCGGYMPPNSMNDFLHRHDINPRDLIAFRYRGRGCPGPTRIETVSETRELHFLDLWGADSSQWSLPFRCKICPDGSGGSPTRAGSVDDPGTKAVVVRTAAGAELLQAAERDGVLTIEYDITPDEMSHYQPHQMHAVWLRYLGLADENRIVPKASRLRIEQLAAELPSTANAYQREGTRRRIRQGKVNEPTPESIKG